MLQIAIVHWDFLLPLSFLVLGFGLILICSKNQQTLICYDFGIRLLI